MRKPFCLAVVCGIVPALVITMNSISPAHTTLNHFRTRLAG